MGSSTEAGLGLDMVRQDVAVRDMNGDGLQTAIGFEWGDGQVGCRSRKNCADAVLHHYHVGRYSPQDFARGTRIVSLEYQAQVHLGILVHLQLEVPTAVDQVNSLKHSQG